MPAKTIGDDAGDGVGRPSRRTRGNDGDGARRIGLGTRGGGGKQPCPGSQDMATFHGFLLLWPGRVLPRPRLRPSWQAWGWARRGFFSEILPFQPDEVVSFC